MTPEDISALLFRHDIVSLVHMGCPTGVYDREARMIAEGMDECEGVEELAELIATTFTEMFCFATNPKTGARRRISRNYKTENKKVAEVAAEIWEEI